MNGLNSFYSTQPYPKRCYEQTLLKKMENADFVLYVNADGTIEVGKNRYTGLTGLIDCSQGVKMLVQFLVGIAYNKYSKKL